jgi:hypothetical protein
MKENDLLHGSINDCFSFIMKSRTSEIKDSHRDAMLLRLMKEVKELRRELALRPKAPQRNEMD